MLRDRRTASGENIAGDAHLNRNLFFGEIAHQFRIVGRMQPVADAVSFQLAQRAPNGLWPDRFSCVHRQTQAMLCGVFVHFAKLLRRGAALIASEPNPNNISVLEMNGLLDYALRFLDSEVAHRIEDPIQRHPELTLAAPPPPLQAFEERCEFLSSPQYNTDGNTHLGMANILRLQLLHHAIGDEFVIFSRAQPLGDRLEGPQKSSEVLVLV